jgi:hypothetical protein
MSQALPQARFGPPSGFGYPLDGLLPAPPRRASFVPTALLGLIPSKRSPPARWRARFRESRTRMPLAATRFPAGRTERTGAPRTDFRALTPARVPGCPGAVSPWLAGCSLGIFPFQGLRRLPCPRFRTDLPSRAWRAKSEDPPYRRPRVSIGNRLARLGVSIASHWRRDSDNLLRVLVPACACGFGTPTPRAMDSPHRQPNVTVRRPESLGLSCKRSDRSPAGSTSGTRVVW